MPHPTGGICPPIAIYALEHGKRIGENILRARRGEAARPFTFVNFGQGINLGRRTAVASPEWQAAQEDARTLFQPGMGIVIGTEYVQKD